MNELITQIIQIASTITLILYAKYEMKRCESKILTTIHEFVNPIDENTPSPLAQFTDSVAEQFVTKLKMGILGQRSGDARLEQAVMQDAVGDILSGQNPVLSMMLDQYFPSWKKRLAKNPHALPVILNIAEKMMSHFSTETKKSKSFNMEEALKKYIG